MSRQRKRNYQSGPNLNTVYVVLLLASGGIVTWVLTWAAGPQVR